MAKYVSDFNEWAKNQYTKGLKDKHIKLIYFASDNSAFAINSKTGKSAFAKCHPEDKFIPQVGMGVAYARLRGMEIPEEYSSIEIGKLQPGDKFMIQLTYRIVKGVIIAHDKSMNKTIWRIFPENFYRFADSPTLVHKI